MAILVTQTISETGLKPVYTAAGGSGDKVTPTRRTFIHVLNQGASGSVTVTVDDTQSIEPPGSTAWNPDLAVTVEAGGSRMIGPIIETRFINTAGYADVTYSTSASVTVAAIEV